MKLLEKKFNISMDIIRCEINPLAKLEKLTNETIRDAVKMYISNRAECERRFGRIENWHTYTVTCMCNLFYNLRNFNADISRWNVSNVRNMDWMFNNAKSFNSDISRWNVSNVRDMRLMFFGAKSFNSKISRWNVSNVRGMSKMFYHATSFDEQYISNWITHPNVDKHNMFG